ncbi:MAG: PIG-L deacetylase family protein [Dehalococcoidia bacterium]|nr:PIG-L deacetylase family protein [Dehalococcoidia bacterium]
MTQETHEEPYRRGMVVVAHPDDAEFGCSGTVAKWCREGMEVVYVIVTDGSKGTSDREITPKELSEMRRREQVAAGKVLGLKDVVFLGHPDAYLQPTLEVRRDIAREIRRYRPDILITLSPMRNLNINGYLGHPDHLAVGEATLSAVYPAARDHLTFPELLKEGLEPHKVREVLIQGHESPDKWIDVTGTIEIAIQALKTHTSQVEGREIEERMRQWRREAGKDHGMEYAEAFKQFILRQ